MQPNPAAPPSLPYTGCVRRAWTVILVVVLGLAAWAVYANILSDDTAVRAQAEAVARDKAGCGKDCKLSRMEGSRGLLNEQIQFTFDVPGKSPTGDKGAVLVECKRAYLAFGAYRCR